MKYVYPAIFTPAEEGYRISVPDLPGLVTYGSSLPDAIEMARDAVEMWLYDAENKNERIPDPSAQKAIAVPDDSFINLIDADTDEYRRENDNRAVKKTLSLPSWLNAKAERANAPFSQILQEGLKNYLGIPDR